MAGDGHGAGHRPRHPRPRRVLHGRVPARLSPARLLALYVVFLAKRDDLLALDARRRIVETVRDFPGLHLRELARMVEMEPKHVEYHVRRLEKAGVVTVRREDQFVRHYPTEEASTGRRDVLDRHQKRALALLRRPAPLHIMLVLLDRGEVDHKGLREAVGLAHGTVSYHLKNLEAEGLVRSRKEGRRTVFSAVDAEATEALLLCYRPPDALVQGFIDTWESFAL